MDTATQRRLDLLEAEVATLRRLLGRRINWQRRLPLALVALLVALLPLGIAAAGPTFSDLGDAAPSHRADIRALGDAGITTGFADPDRPGQRLYEPKGAVTREEMASFLARTAGLGDHPPVARAASALTVPDGAVTAAKLSPAGASTGQVLVATGTGVAWQDVTGAPGPPGPAGPPGMAVAIVRSFAGEATVSGLPVTINCLPGERATGGGYDVAPGLTVNRSEPLFDPATHASIGWLARAGLPGPIGALPLTVYAICVPLAP